MYIYTNSWWLLSSLDGCIPSSQPRSQCSREETNTRNFTQVRPSGAAALKQPICIGKTLWSEGEVLLCLTYTTVLLGEKLVQKLIWSTDGPIKSTETRQGWKHARRLPYFGAMAENKDKNTTLHLLHDSSRCRVVFLSFFSATVLK